MRKTITAIILLLAGAALCAPVKSIVASEGIEYEVVSEGPSCADYIQDGLVLCLDAIENVAMGVSDHSVPYVFNIARGGAYYKLDQIVFNETSSSFDRPATYVLPRSEDVYCEPFRKLNATIEYCAFSNIPGSTAIGNGWGIGVKPSTNGWSFVFCSLKNNQIRVSKDTTQRWDSLTPSNPTHSSVVLSGKTLYSYVSGKYEQKKEFVSEGYQFYNYFAVGNIPNYSDSAIHQLCCFRLYNRALSEEEIAHNQEIDRIRFNLP